MVTSCRNATQSAILILGGLSLLAGLVQLSLMGHASLGSDIAFVLTVVCAAVFVILDPSYARKILTGRVARYGSNAFLMSVAFVGLVAVANVLVAQHGFQIDLTEDREFTLSPQSVEVLKQSQDEVHIWAFFADDDPSRGAAEDLLAAYAQTSPLLTYEFVDPEKNPDLAREYGVDAFGATIFERGDRRQRVTLGASEQNYTAALLRISRDQTKNVYFLSGHEERNINDESPNGYLAAMQALRREGYNVASLNLTIEGTVPEDAAALIVAAPAKSILPEEEQAILDFVERGGGLFVLGDVRIPPPLESLLQQWGVEFDDDGMVDPSAGLFGNVSTPVISNFEFDPIAGGLAAAFFPGVRSLSLRSPSNDTLLIPLARTSADSWGETNFADRQVSYNAGEDLKGPLPIVGVVETKTTDVEELTGGKPKVRIVVTGDSDFPANANFNRLSNGDLFLTSVNWLAHEEVLLAIGPRTERLRRLLLTAGDMRVVFYSSTIFLPLAALLVAGVIWWRRR